MRSKRARARVLPVALPRCLQGLAQLDRAVGAQIAHHRERTLEREGELFVLGGARCTEDAAFRATPDGAAVAARDLVDVRIRAGGLHLPRGDDPIERLQRRRGRAGAADTAGSMRRTGDRCRTILAGRDRFCHMAVFSFSLEDMVMTRSVRFAPSAPFDRSARFESSARTVRSNPRSSDLRTQAAPSRAIVAPDPPVRRTGCAVCGSPEIASDEVMHRGLWLLGECCRCGHRWTERPSLDGPLPAPASLRPVAAAFDEEDFEAPHAA